MGKPLVDLTGDQIGYWTVLGRSENKGGHAQWLCRCKCGNEKVVIGIVLRDRRSRSCGCLHSEVCKTKSLKHGGARGGDHTPAYRSWGNMRRRCTNPKDKNYPYYGGRGITICERWCDFENFLADMGEPQEGLTLERKNNSGNYNKENCKWASRCEQSRNKRNNRHLEFNGKRQSVLDWSVELDIPYNRIMTRLWRGWTVDKALSS